MTMEVVRTRRPSTTSTSSSTTMTGPAASIKDPVWVVAIIIALVLASVGLVSLATCMWLFRNQCKKKSCIPFRNKFEKLVAPCSKIIPTCDFGSIDELDDATESLLKSERRKSQSKRRPSYNNVVAYLETQKGIKYNAKCAPKDKINFVIPPSLPPSVAIQLYKTQCANADNCYQCRNHQTDKRPPSDRRGSVDELNIELYNRHRDNSQMSSEVGKICFGLKYDEVNQYLLVNIIKAAYIQPYGMKETADACVRVELISSGSSEQRMTKVVRGTRNPVFNESFAFLVPPLQVNTRTLCLTACDYDRFSRQVAIGSVRLPVADVLQGQKEEGQGEERWWYLSKDGKGKTYQGELMFSLRHLPDQKLIRVVIMRAKSLRLRSISQDLGNSCVYAKASVLYKDRVVVSKRTRLKEDLLCPSFNEELDFRYDDKSRLSETYLVVTLCSKTTFGVKRLIGKTIVGPGEYATGGGLMHWMDMLAAPNSTVAQWHVLR